MTDRLKPLIVVPAIVDGGVAPFNLDLAPALRERGLVVEHFTIPPYDPAVWPTGHEDPHLTVGPGRFGSRRSGSFGAGGETVAFPRAALASDCALLRAA